MVKQKITEQEFIKAAQIIGCEVEVIKAVAEIESRGSGFNRDGAPKILFEGHWFHRLTKGKYTGNIQYSRISYEKWTRKFYGNQTNEHKRLDQAVKLDRGAALQSASWGAFQIMGFNYKRCGYDRLQDFINAMFRSEGEHLMAFIGFVKSMKLDDELRNKDWAKFAYSYNGPSYKVNNYDVKMNNAYLKYKKK
jgi:hypothetical protein